MKNLIHLCLFNFITSNLLLFSYGSIKCAVSNFFRLNLIALKINNFYKLNIYFLIFLFVSIISSVLIRTGIINNVISYCSCYDNNIIFVIFYLLYFFASIYSFYLTLTIANRIIQGYKIIPEFIKLYKENVINIKSVIIYYYLQNVILILLSSWILYLILSKLNIFHDNIYLFILSLGIILSSVLLYYYPIMNNSVNTNIKVYSIWIYLLLIFCIIFYIFLLPFIIINVINVNKCMEYIINLPKLSINNEYLYKLIHYNIYLFNSNFFKYIEYIQLLFNNYYNKIIEYFNYLEVEYINKV